MSLAEKSKVVDITAAVKSKPKLKLADPVEQERKESVVIPVLVAVSSLVWDGIKSRAQVLPELIGEGIGWILRRVRETGRAFWGAVWTGTVFPLRMSIIDYRVNEDLINSRMVGRLSGLVVVSIINSVLLLVRKKGFLVGGLILGVISLINPLAWEALKLVLMIPVVVYLPLGFWKAMTYQGLKKTVVEALNRSVEGKKCEKSGE